MVLSPNDGCVLILPMKHFAGLGVLAIGLMGCGGEAPAPSTPAAETNYALSSQRRCKTNTTPGNANISIKPTTEIPAAKPVKPKPSRLRQAAPAATPAATNNATSSGAAIRNHHNRTQPNKVQGEGNLTKKNGAFFSGDSPFNGQFVDHHDNGVKSVEGRFENGIQQGAWTFYHENGSRFRSGQYMSTAALMASGSFWREDGSKWSEQSYVNGQLNGLETRWHPNGQKQSETT